jgi:gliding motility-associated-like protein
MIVWFHSNAQENCPPPFELNTEKINDSTISANWQMEGTYTGQSTYEAEYRDIYTATWTKAYFPYGNDAELCWLINAKRGTCYYLRIRAVCKFTCGIYHPSSWVTIVINTGAASCPSPPPNPPDPPAPPCPPDPPIPPSPTPVVSPNFSFSIDPCFPGRVSFSNSTTVSGTTFRSNEWDLGDNTRSTSNNPVHIYQSTGNYQVALTVTDNSGKTYTKTINVAIPTLIKRFADAGRDQEVCTTDTFSLQASGGESYSWSPCTGLSNCRIPNPTLEPGTTGIYIVTVTNKDGCIDTDTVFVKYIDPTTKLYIPNAFTPNNDGLNDQFRPLVSLQGQVDAEWKLFNRFGNMIFSSNSSTEGWDGKYKGEIQPPGNYTYMITIKATGGCPARNLKGTVLLIR